MNEVDVIIMAINYEENIKIKWYSKVRDHYLSKGYPELKHKEEFVLPIKDLPASSNQIIPVYCDICNKQVFRNFNTAKNSKTHYCSNECQNYNKHSKEFLISEFYRYYKEHGKYPYVKDMKVKDGYPSNYYYLKVWGSWNNFISELGITEETGNDNCNWYKKDIETLKSIYHCATKEEIESKLMKKFCWSNIQSKARELGLKRNQYEFYSRGFDKEFLINEFYRYFNMYNKYPLKKDMNEADGFPSYVPYERIWGSYSNFLKEIGILEKNNSDGWLIHDENVLREKYPTHDKQEIIDSLMITRKWDTIKAKASSLGVKRKINRKKYTNEELLMFLRKYKDEHGQVPTSIDFDNSEKYPSYKVYAQRFGSWNNALKMVGFQLNLIKVFNKEDIINEARDFYCKHNRSPFHYELSFSSTAVKGKFPSWNSMLTEAELPINIDDKEYIEKDELLLSLKESFKRENKLPDLNTISKEIGVNRNIFAKKFGSYRHALFEAGLINKYEVTLDYDEFIINNLLFLRKLADRLNRIPSVQEYVNFINSSNEERVLSRENLCRKLGLTYLELCETYLPSYIIYSDENGFYRNNLDERCRSYPEMIISNLFIKNGLKYSYENLYKDYMDIDSNYMFDWVIHKEKKNIAVEYFGYYDQSETKYDLIRDYIAKAEEKISLCRKNNVDLIDIYPEDIENNFEGLIKKFTKCGIELSI